MAVTYIGFMPSLQYWFPQGPEVPVGFRNPTLPPSQRKKRSSLAMPTWFANLLPFDLSAPWLTRMTSNPAIMGSGRGGRTATSFQLYSYGDGACGCPLLDIRRNEGLVTAAPSRPRETDVFCKFLPKEGTMLEEVESRQVLFSSSSPLCIAVFFI